uniref:Si:dkey-175g6.2 n=1 Tax=Astyanax mexicanus TaxID=7994 RepID=W5LSY2_ASTMX
MVMICCHTSCSTSALLLLLLSIAPQLPTAAPLLTESSLTRTSNETLQLVHQDLAVADGAARTHRKVDRDFQTATGQGHLTDMDSARALASVLLEALDHPTRDEVIGGRLETEEYVGKEPGQEPEMWRDQDESREGRVDEENVKVLQSGGTESTVDEQMGEEEKVELTEARLSDENDTGNNESTFEGKEELLQSLLSRKTEIPPQIASSLQRKTRGYFQNIDLGLQDNEILPPLKGYKAYNQQLALATKKLKWQQENERNPSQLDRNFMDDFDFIEEEEEVLPREEEEARARAEQEEVRRQEAEAQEAREEEQRLADIASDMLLQYMGRKQKAASYIKDMKKASLLNNVAEDKRSNEVEDSEDDEMDPETIDKLIEISSKLHLPADDVVEIITDVEEKKKRKDSPPVNAPRFRPLVPLKAKQRAPVYQYPKSPKKSAHKVNPYKKWYKDKSKAKFNKQDYWFKPQKQLLAYPSFPYYQKPYRAYYPVYFPPPKPRFYTNPRRYRDRAKVRERNWAQGARQPQIKHIVLKEP